MNNLFPLISDRLDVGVIVLDKDYKILVWNGWLQRFTGKSSKQAIGAKLTDICPRLNKKIYYQIFEDAILHGKNRFCSGALHHYFISPAKVSRCSTLRQNMLVQPVQLEDVRFILIQIFDITSQHLRVQQLKSLINELTITYQKLKDSEETIKHQAYHDFMTGLPNRLLLMDRLNHAMEHSRRNKHNLAILFLDLDRFKLINDTLGHAVGDQLLQEIANRLTSCVRKSDTVARLGGDEFVLLLSEITEPESVAVIAMKIINTIVKPWVYHGQEFFITASVGISLFPNDGENAEVLINNADIAMYRAKELGKNNYEFFDEEMYAISNHKLALEVGIRRAIERNEFLVYYQPKLDLITRKIIGLEALVRWQHPDEGIVYPMEFIPIAEEYGLIVPISEWVIHSACAQNKAWQDAGFSPVIVSVNISARELQQKGLVDIVIHVLQETGLEPCWLELEVSGDIAIRNVELAIDILQELQKLGIRISLSSTAHLLSCLKSLPINTLKIEQSYVRNLTVGEDHSTIVSLVIALGQSLNLKVIAEGVETVEQLLLLKQMQCDEVQGFLFSEPVPAEAIQDLLVKQEFTDKALINGVNMDA